MKSILFLFATLAGALAAQTTPSTIVDTLYNPDGSKATCTIYISNPAFLDSANQLVPANTIQSLVTNGNVNVTILPTTNAITLGVLYNVQYSCMNGPPQSSTSEFWSVPPGTGLTLSQVRVAPFLSIGSASIPGSFNNTIWSTAFAASVNGASAEAINRTIAGSSTPAAEFQTLALSGAIIVPTGATQAGATAVGGYIVSNSSVTDAVGVQGFAFANAAGALIWGANFVAYDQVGVAGATITGIEVDVNPNNSTTIAAGISVGGSGLASPAQSRAFTINNLGPGIPWIYGFLTMDGACDLAISIGSVSLSNNVASQNIQLTSRDSGGTGHFGYIYQNPTGTVVIKPDVVSNSNTFQIGATGIPAASTFSGSGSRPLCVTSTGQFEVGSVSSGLVTCP